MFLQIGQFLIGQNDADIKGATLFGFWVFEFGQLLDGMTSIANDESSMANVRSHDLIANHIYAQFRSDDEFFQHHPVFVGGADFLNRLLGREGDLHTPGQGAVHRLHNEEFALVMVNKALCRRCITRFDCEPRRAANARPHQGELCGSLVARQNGGSRRKQIGGCAVEDDLTLPIRHPEQFSPTAILAEAGHAGSQRRAAQECYGQAAPKS